MKSHPLATARDLRRVARTLVAGAVVALSLSIPATAWADAAPVRRLPMGPTTTVIANRGSLVAVACRASDPRPALVWRPAGRVDPAILRQVSEAGCGPSVVLVSARRASAPPESLSRSRVVTAGRRLCAQPSTTSG